MSKGGGDKVLSNITSQMQGLLGQGKPSHRPTPAPTQLMNFSTDYKKLSAELEELRESSGQGLKVSLDKIFSSPYQSQVLNADRVAGLVENLKSNPQSSPVVLRANPNGEGYELIAGHHRVAAFKALQRESIWAVVVDLDDDACEKLVFYDNLLAPTLYDYEKYLGLANRVKSKGLTLKELSEESGLSQSTVSRLMSFEKLPEDTQKLLAANPAVGTALLFYELAGYANSTPDLMLKAVQQVIEGKLPISKVRRFMSRANSSSTEKNNKEEGVTLVTGTRKLCEIKTNRKQVVLKFESIEVAEKMSQVLTEFLKENMPSLD